MNPANCLRSATLWSSFAILAASAVAQDEIFERQRIPGPFHSANAGNNPGLASNDLRGNTLVVGATRMALGQGASALGSVGAAYVYTRTAAGAPWTLQAELRPNDPVANQFFGLNVSVQSSRVAVGSLGAVYLFERSGGVWAQTGKILRSPVARGMSLDGDLLAVGDWTATVNGQANAGLVSIHRFQNGSWVHEADLADPTPDSEDAFGRHVSMSANRALVYSANHSNGFSDPVAHVFVRGSTGTWRLEATLQPDWSTPILAHTFRLSALSISADTILIQGGPRAALFDRAATGVWQQVQVIDKRVWGFDSNDYYQDLRGDTFVVSSSQRVYDGQGFVSLVFRRVGGLWVKQAVLTQTDGFGLALPQIDGDTVVVTRGDVDSPCSTGPTPTCGKGAIFAYELVAVPESYGAGCAGATVPALSVDAIPDLGVLGDTRLGGQLDFSIENAAPGSVGFLVIGGSKAFLPLGGGCALQIAAIPDAFGPLILSGAPSSPAGSGHVQFSLLIPALAPLRFMVQVLVVDPDSPNGLVTVTAPAEVQLR